VQKNVILVPVWTVQGGKYIWVNNNGKPVLKTVTVGPIHGSDIEITGGLTSQDHIITDPQSITNSEYIQL
jgi:multidrug efflux pump subunit AcrA (membrane-fusion protein)